MPTPSTTMTMKDTLTDKIHRDFMKSLMGSNTLGGNSHCVAASGSDSLQLDTLIEAKKLLGERKNPLVELAEKNGADLSNGDRMIIPASLVSQFPELRSHMTDEMTISTIIHDVLIISSPNK